MFKTIFSFEPRNTFLLALLLVGISVSAQQWEYAALRNQAQLSAGLTGGEGGQWPQALAVSSNGRFLMAGLDVAGLIRSENGGNIWKQANAGYTPRGNCAIAIDPNNSNRVLAVGGNSSFNNNLQLDGQNIHGIYLSTDKGKSWKRVLGVDNLAGWRDIREQLAWDPSSNNGTIGGSAIAYWSRAEYTYTQPASSSTPVTPGIYKTVDGGVSWNLIPHSEKYNESIIKVHPTNHNVYIANKSGVYRSKNGGKLFLPVFSGEVTGLDIIPTQPNNVYICTKTALYRFIDINGRDSLIPIKTNNFPENAAFIKVSPANANRMMVQSFVDTYDTPWYYSHDGGVTWKMTVQDNSLNYFYNHSGRKMYPVWHPTSPDTVWCVGGDWITRSTDGGATLKWSNNGSSMICQTGYFAFSVNNPNLLAVTTQDYHASLTTNNGATWKYFGKGILNLKNSGFAYGGYALTSDTVFFRRSEVSRGPTEIVVFFDGGKSLFDTKITVGGEMTGYGSPTNPQVVFLGDHRSGDRGCTWALLEGCTGVFTHNIRNPTEIFGVNNAATKSLVASVDNGVSWKVIRSFGDTTIRDIAYDHNQDIFYIAAEFKLIKYNRRTGQYINITEKVPADQLGRARQFRTVAVDPVNTDIVYVGNRRDVYASDVSICRSTDGGATNFIPLTKSPRHNNLNLYGDIDAGREVQCIRVHPVTREAWVGCATYGLWKIKAPDIATFSTVQWGAVTAKKMNNELIINWTTDGEKGNRAFEIEVSPNQSDFYKIGGEVSLNLKGNKNYQYKFAQPSLMGWTHAAMIVYPLLIWGFIFLRRKKHAIVMLSLFFLSFFSCRKFDMPPDNGEAKYARVVAISLTGYKSYSQAVAIQE